MPGAPALPTATLLLLAPAASYLALIRPQVFTRRSRRARAAAGGGCGGDGAGRRTRGPRPGPGPEPGPGPVQAAVAPPSRAARGLCAAARPGERRGRAGEGRGREGRVGSGRPRGGDAAARLLPWAAPRPGPARLLTSLARLGPAGCRGRDGPGQAPPAAPPTRRQRGGTDPPGQLGHRPPAPGTGSGTPQRPRGRPGRPPTAPWLCLATRRAGTGSGGWCTPSRCAPSRCAPSRTQCRHVAPLAPTGSVPPIAPQTWCAELVRLLHGRSCGCCVPGACGTPCPGPGRGHGHVQPPRSTGSPGRPHPGGTDPGLSALSQVELAGCPWSPVPLADGDEFLEDGAEAGPLAGVVLPAALHQPVHLLGTLLRGVQPHTWGAAVMAIGQPRPPAPCPPRPRPAGPWAWFQADPQCWAHDPAVVLRARPQPCPSPCSTASRVCWLLRLV